MAWCDVVIISNVMIGSYRYSKVIIWYDCTLSSQWISFVCMNLPSSHPPHLLFVCTTFSCPHQTSHMDASFHFPNPLPSAISSPCSHLLPDVYTLHTVAAKVREFCHILGAGRAACIHVCKTSRAAVAPLARDPIARLENVPWKICPTILSFWNGMPIGTHSKTTCTWQKNKWQSVTCLFIF